MPGISASLLMNKISVLSYAYDGRRKERMLFFGHIRHQGSEALIRNR